MTDDPWQHMFSDSDAQQEIAAQVHRAAWRRLVDWLKGGVTIESDCCGFGTCEGCPQRGKYRRS